MKSPITKISAIGTGATGFALFSLLSQWYQLKKKHNQYQLINEFTPTSILNYFNQSQKTTIEAFIAGELVSESPIISKVPLIMREKKIYYIYENGVKKIIQTFLHGASQLSIADYYNKIEIWRNSTLNYQLSMSHIWDKVIPQQLSFLQRLTNFILKIINQLKIRKLFFNGFPTGLLEREYGIIANEFYVIYGEIILDKKLNKMFLQNPKYILKSKKQLLFLIQKQIKYKSSMIVIVFILFAIWSCIFGCNIKNFIIHLLKERQKAKLDKLRGQKYLEINNYECQVCFERPRNIIFKPCKHLSICHECSQRLKKPQCPICKQQIEDKIEIFFT
ncbi:unnamed protein product (macronuclear) [Paramecium tetraurelia]|uniref:RING-type domain-containing protein n=1 Tax=Paramecium tetraurelia TaxID=5888 RepID=A0BRE5_PARTE|nr:uncharacterized protein GSPATT00031343001 [Paramecium tetraurelia]CAK61112.1 unnamed protein product [Paramecium tetraurelia]|eukprot:XP_001428510.1 hypothetical protein (macronuclear) [Paramecium tetraurelia strain d4-2]